MPRYTHAIVSRIPNNVQLDSQTVNTGIDLGRARRDQEAYCEVLRSSGLDVIELAPEDSAPASSLFVDDVSIVCNGTALVTRPSHSARRKEIIALFMELGIPVVETPAEGKKVMLEGSDVLFTGREIFVGLSKKTNEAGAQFVAATFPDFPVTAVKVEGNGHLKQYVCVAAPHVLTVGTSKEAANVLKRIEREATFRYQTLTMPSDVSANCLHVNNFVIYRADLPEAAQKFKTLEDLNPQGVNLSELSKLGGLLSQHCILFRRIKLLKKL